MIKLKPRLKPNYSLSDWRAAFGFFRSDSVADFERNFAQKFENRYGVMFQHGRTGLYALLKVWGLKNDEVVCPAYTCVVVPTAVVLSGNIPVFVDCGKGSFNMDTSLLEKAITKKTRAVIVTHLFGYPMDTLKINKIVKESEKKYGHKIYVIQDVAHSFGAKWKGRYVTTFGDASIFGLNISKMINSIFGGMVLTDDEDTRNKLLIWRHSNTVKKGFFKEIKRLVYFISVNIAFNSYVYGFVNFLERKGFLDRFVKYYEEGKLSFPDDWNCFPSKIEARVGLNQLKKYDMIVSGRVGNALKWKEKLHGKDVIFLKDYEGCTFSHCTGLSVNREELLEKYRQMGFQLGIIVEYSVPYMKAFSKYARGEYPVSLDYSKKSVNFPNWV